MAGAKTPEQLIEEQYQKLIEAQAAKIGADYDVSKQQYESRLAGAGAAYQPLRNEAYVNNALAERARKENMANMGLSGEGGTSTTIEQRNTQSLLSGLGDISRQQRGYEDEITLALAGLNTTRAADLSKMRSELESKRAAALLAQKQAEADDTLNRDRLAASQEEDLFSRYYQLYKARMITKKQFEDATGIDLK